MTGPEREALLIQCDVLDGVILRLSGREEFQKDIESIWRVQNVLRTMAAPVPKRTCTGCHCVFNAEWDICPQCHWNKEDEDRSQRYKEAQRNKS